MSSRHATLIRRVCIDLNNVVRKLDQRRVFKGKVQNELKRNIFIGPNLKYLFPVHGGFSDWSVWTQCNQTCGTGSNSRSRQCDTPPPQHNGNPCSGTTYQLETCNTHFCPSKFDTTC